jgi:hypothetical protein
LSATDEAKSIVGDAVNAAAGKLGVSITPEETAAVEAFTTMIVDAINRKAWTDAAAKGQAAADKIVTDADAENSLREP